jgi:2-oxoisovalerate dehydrogenase E1 component
MVGVQVDGNDIGAVGKAAGDAVRRARTGGGPTLIECKTYRTRPHSEGMGDYSYRTREEVAAWRERCPIKRFRVELLANGHATEAELDAIDGEIVAEIAVASKEAENAPWPAAVAATTHVYAENSTRANGTEPGVAGGAGREISLAAATLEALDREMATNPRIFVLGEGIGQRGGNFGTTAGLYAKYGAERLRDTPICERGFVGLACGAAMTGARPVVDFMFVDFLNDAFGELVNQVAKMQYMSSGRLKMPVLLRGCIGVGHSAATHHSGSYYSIYSHIPGLRIVVPSTPYDAQGLFTHALRCDDPVLFLEPRELMSVKGPVPAEPYEIEFGKARVVQEGRQITVVAIALMVQRVLTAARQLTEEGFSIEVIDPRTVSPLDTTTILASVKKTGRLLIVEEVFAPCSLAAEIAAQAADAGFDSLDAPIKRLNGAFAPTPYSPVLEKAVIPNVESIAEAIRSLINE